jgi:hypothetical protein
MLVLLAASAGLSAQTAAPSESTSAAAPAPAYTTPASHTTASVPVAPAPFSRIAFGGGISAMGINLQAAVNANRYINLRGVGNVFNYTIDNIDTNGMTLNGKLNLASAGVSVDFYPWPNHGFRISPGTLFYNQNTAHADITVDPGTSFSLNDYDYYASKTNPVKGYANLGLNTNNPAFTITTGWGNMISRRGGHWSFPFEIGAAFMGSPKLDFALNSGQVCDSNGLNCVDVATNADVQSNLQAQIAKYKNDLDPFRYYPILSFGVSYNFNVRPQSTIK